MPRPKIDDFDPSVPFLSQLDTVDTGPIVLLNVFTVAHEDIPAMLDTWQRDSAVMRGQPGFISAQLHQGISGSGVFANYAVWESIEHFKQACANPEFQAAIAGTPASAVARPHVFKKIAVPGVCVA
ncbi:antibiotic biosynthesis monooxygenase [Burkholderia gladioli pv. gladioli]|uniref:Antibiotic biosynthesis monooxygenase n=1 Tax=Burkholderia gladioli TaxID=28095 RepID=A0A095F408_BURGA|nr:antibiotic biosynthesis monooxygenase family protein [Burkholderia gladioli]ASD79979.1 antibiotic biosynthesis monooxygenase [Burkholderia gladioli pv. gladioli]AWY54775.1 antibiotic biosynthesis monooxygenase [Burkholderia gladioli pv. gladioli]KGC11695.1 antibiotic biosynthesis monooxygenase family protein [Burkholderia gladioli]MDJ1164239.1 antibiotic biosynthesis monooxygenase [Burkholderia gladioli pv. gladioli]PEH37789.1 antibiotic biosynthesis monooxygenase [Burkholderia gladioli]